MLEVYQPRCPVRVACMKQAWVNLVNRVATGRTRILDNRRLQEVLDALELMPEHFSQDVEAARKSEQHTAPRLRGEWHNLPTYTLAKIDDEGLTPID